MPPVAIVTGGTFGIGRATAVGLARRGYRVAVVGRDRARAEETVRELAQVSRAPVPEPLLADLASPRDVARLAGDIVRRFDRLDVLVDNAGGMFTERATGEGGFERTWALNHLAYVGLTIPLVPLLVSTGASRVVVVSSAMHRGASIRFDDLQGERSFSGTRAYGQSKLANLLFAFALARRLAPTQVTVNAVHPGVVRSGIDRGMTGVLGALTRLAKPFLLTPEGGAATSVHVATAPELVGVTGRYFAKEREARPSSLARDEALQERLFVESLAQLGLRDPFVVAPAVTRRGASTGARWEARAAAPSSPAFA